MPHYNSKTRAEEVAENNKATIAGKVVLITGVTPGGLGAAFAEILSKYSPKLLILAGRDEKNLEKEAATIKATSPEIATRQLVLDLASQEQIRKAAAEVIAYPENIDVLVNNAGVMASPYVLTKDGLETQFGINHIGHFLFTNLIIKKLLAAGKGSRVVSVSSDGYRLGPIRFDDWKFDDGKTYDRWRAYGQAKTANMLFAVSLAKKLGDKGLVSVSLHPGVIATNLLRYMGAEELAELQKQDRDLGWSKYWGGFTAKDFSEGTATHFFAAFDPTVSEHNGAYLADSQITAPEGVRSWGRDPVEAEQLWKLSEEIVGEKFEY